MPAVFACSGAQWLLDKIDETVQTCGAWIGSATSTVAADQAWANLNSAETTRRTCGTHSQPTSIRSQWVGTQTYNVAHDVGSAGNFPATSTGTVGGLIVVGEFSPIVALAADAIQFTIQLDIT